MLNLFFIELKRTVLMTIRYPLNFIVQVVMLICLFYLLFMGSQFFASTPVPERDIETMIVNYFLWTLAISTIAAVPKSVEEDARAGTLEQILQTAYKPSTFFMVRGFCVTLVEVLTSVLSFLLIVVTSGVYPELSAQILINFFSIIICALGLSMLIGGLGVRIKRTGMILNAFQLPLLLLLMYPFEKHFDLSLYSWLKVLPFVGDSIQARTILVGSGADIKYQSIAMAVSFIVLILGASTFTSLLKKTKQDGKTSGY